MAFHGIDITAGEQVTVVLRTAAHHAAAAVELVHDAELLADHPVHVALRLDEIGRDLSATASAIATASDALVGFHIGALLASRRGPRLVRTPLDRVHQSASHNSFAVPGGIRALHDAGFRTFELDIHRGAPTDLTPGPGPLPWLLRLLIDHLDHAGGRHDDWRVYHATGDEATEYEYLSDGLAEIVALNSDELITVFVDNKDAFGGTHTPGQLTDLLESTLQDRLFTPADLMRRTPGAVSLHAAVVEGGWPSADELAGRVMVVLTDNLDTERDVGYFVAPPPRFETVDGEIRHLPEPNAVIYNASRRTITAIEIAAVQQTRSLIRTYGNLAPTERAPIAPNFYAFDA